MKFLYAPHFDLYKARKIKGHYRHLKNGKIVYIDEHLDKRKEAKKDPEKYRQRVIYADDKSTHIMNDDGTVTRHPHDESKELSDTDKVSRMGHSIPIDKDLATEMFRKKNWLEDPERWKAFQDKIKKNAKEKGIEGKKGEVSDELKKEHKKLTDAYGERISRANAYLHGNRQLRDHLESRGNKNDYDAAEHRLATENSENFEEYLEKFKKQVKLADTKTAADCPTIVGLSPGISFYGHQAEALARLNVLDKAVVDVDMGGGKGLLLPADAMNLMAQGKIKKPLIVVPTNTLEQNAKLTVDAYTEGRVNVFKIDNAILKKQFDGDLDTLCKAIDEAPPNTIFMVGYDFVAANHGANPDEPRTHYKNAQRLSGVGFDYVALDEAHRIKNVETSRWEATQLLANAPYKRVASGTFISNNPADCLGQISFLHPHVAMTEKDFKIKYGYIKTASNKDKKVAGVTKWSKEGTKRLREDLKDYGMISIRRSAWINKLPQRNEGLSVCKPSPELRRAYDNALEDTIKSMQEEDGFDEFDDMVSADDEMKGAMVMKLNALQAISDYPDLIATMIDDAVAKMGGKRAANRAVKGDEEMNRELEETIEFLKRFSPATRNELSKLKGTVSPKALDVYKKMEEHFKDPKNGKFIVFCQRKLSAQHILDHMPDHLKEKALYYDASKKSELKEWATDPKGPQILVAVDASITEGVNLQLANGMYRYDHHYPVAEGTLVSCEKGLVRIETLSGTELVDTATTPEQGTAVKSRGIEPTLDVETEHGWRCGFALDHPVMVLNRDMSIGYKEAQNLVDGDLIAIKSEPSTLWPAKSIYNIDEAYFVGYMLANGWLRSNRDEMGFCDGDVGHRHHFATLAASLFNEEPKVDEIKNEVGIYAVESRILAENLGLETFKARSKHLPEAAFRCGKQETIALLHGLWADGTVSSGTPTFASSSRELAGDVQLLLQRFGIMSKITPWQVQTSVLKDGRKINGGIIYQVSVSGGVFTKRFAEIFSKLPPSYRNDKIMRWAGKTLNCGRNEKATWANTVPGMAYHVPINGVGFPAGWKVKVASYNHLERIKFRTPQIERHLETKLTWSKVSKISDGGTKRVWCIVDVEREHNFVANGMLVHNSPGTQEQSYARIWRPGQEKPVNIHLGVVDDTMDVTKVARMISKLHTNMMVTSDMDDDDTFEAYTLNIENIRNNRNAHILPEYLDMGKKILDFQIDEGKDYDKRYKGEKDGKYPRGSAAPLGGAAAKDMHGMPGYQEYGGGVVGSGFLDDDSKDKILGHFRDYIRTKLGKDQKHMAYDRELESSLIPHVIALAERHAASPSRDSEVTPQLFNAYNNEYERDTGDKFTGNTAKIMKHAVDAWATKKQAPPHTADSDHEGALTAIGEHLSMGLKPKEIKDAAPLLKELLNHLGSKTIKHLGNGEMENPEIADKFWKDRAKKKGYDLDDTVKEMYNGAAALIHENQKGYQGVKHYFDDEE